MSTAMRVVDRGLKPDIVIVRDLPLMQVGKFIARRVGAKLWFDMAEDYPATFGDISASRLARLTVRNYQLARRYEDWALSVADVVTTVVEESRERVTKLKPDKPSRWCKVITNSPDDYFLAQPRDIDLGLRSDNRKTIMYHGNISEKRGLQVAIAAIELLYQRGIDVRLLVLGKPDIELRNIEDLASSMGVSHMVECRPPVPYEHLPAAISVCDIGLIPHLSCEHTETTIPNKLFDMMALGKSVIVSNVAPLRRIVEHARCGLVYRWNSPEELATAVETLVVNQTLAVEMGNAGMEAFTKEYSWSQQERTIETVLRELR